MTVLCVEERSGCWERRGQGRVAAAVIQARRAGQDSEVSAQIKLYGGKGRNARGIHSLLGAHAAKWWVESVNS